VRDGAGNLHPLGESAGELAGIDGLALGEQELFQQLQGARLCLPVAHAEIAAVKIEVLKDGQRTVEGVELWHHTDLAARMGRVLNDIDAVNAHRSGGGQGARGADTDGGGFACPVGPQQTENLALLQLHVDAVHGNYAELGFIDLCQCFDLDYQEFTRRGKGSGYVLQITAVGERWAQGVFYRGSTQRKPASAGQRAPSPGPPASCRSGLRSSR